MADYKVPLEDMQFVIHNVLGLPELWGSLAKLSDIDAETADAVLQEAAKFCENVLAPLNREADEEGSHWDEGAVRSPEGFVDAYRTYSEGGWVGLGGNPEYEGMGMPKSLVAAVEEMVQGANVSFGLCPMLSAGAALAMDAHANEELKQRYLPKLYSGEWAGAMDLTEPHCGTDLGLIRTKAVPQNDGSYKVTGTKIFITWGEHDMADNIIHLVLAKLPDAPKGSRGISLFLVPKVLPTDEGGLGERNGVHCGSIEKKMGIKASATCVMNFDEATGWIIGEPNQGLACMFTMMNYERLGVGIQGLGLAEASYQTALEYAKERIQGRSATGTKFPDKAADNLVVHPDVRRMLLTQKAFNEAGRAFVLYAAQFLDIAKFSDDEETRARAEKIAAFLTPITKAFMTDVALQCTVHGQQVLGGHGYVREWGQEQRVRDVRITQIYEGTNGIQAMDLIGRKTVACGGEFMGLFADDIRAFIEDAKTREHNLEFCQPLAESLNLVLDLTDHVVTQAQQDPNAAGAAAVDYLDAVGYLAYAFMWAKMVDAANVDNAHPDRALAKRQTAQFYFHKLLPQLHALNARIRSGSESLMALDEALF